MYFLKFLWRHDFVQKETKPRCFLKMVDGIIHENTNTWLSYFLSNIHIKKIAKEF